MLRLSPTVCEDEVNMGMDGRKSTHRGLIALMHNPYPVSAHLPEKESTRLVVSFLIGRTIGDLIDVDVLDGRPVIQAGSIGRRMLEPSARDSTKTHV